MVCFCFSLSLSLSLSLSQYFGVLFRKEPAQLCVTSVGEALQVYIYIFAVDLSFDCIFDVCSSSLSLSLFSLSLSLSLSSVRVCVSPFLPPLFSPRFVVLSSSSSYPVVHEQSYN